MNQSTRDTLRQKFEESGELFSRGRKIDLEAKTLFNRATDLINDSVAIYDTDPEHCKECNSTIPYHVWAQFDYELLNNPLCSSCIFKKEKNPSLEELLGQVEELFERFSDLDFDLRKRYKQNPMKCIKCTNSFTFDQWRQYQNGHIVACKLCSVVTEKHE